MVMPVEYNACLLTLSRVPHIDLWYNALDELMRSKKSPEVIENTQAFTSRSEADTLRFASTLSAGFSGREIVLLTGELGAGKTVFTKGMAAGLGFEDINQVNSPSYTLLNIYQARYPIFHWDLYRLTDGGEIDELGWEEFLGQGVMIVEWAEKLGPLAGSIRVTLEILPDESRLITIRS